MKRISILLLCSICSVAVMAQGLAPILQIIEQNNTKLKAARESNAAQLAEVKAENTLGETSVEYTPFHQQGVSGTSSSELIVSQEFDFPTLYVARQKEATIKQKELDLQYQTLRRDVLLEAKITCYELFSAIKTKHLLASRIANADSLLYAYNRRFEQGDANLIDLNRIKLDRMTVSAELIRNERQIKSLQFELQRLNGGESILGFLDPTATLSQDFFADELNTMRMKLSEANLSAESTLQGVQSLETSAAEASLNASTQELKVAKQNWAPKLTLGYRRDTEMSEASHGVLMGVSVPLFGNGRKVKAARLRRSTAEEELHHTQVEQDATFNALLSESRELSLLLDNYDERLMNETLRLLRTSVMAGQMSVVDYYTEADRIYELLHERIDTEVALCKVLTKLNGRFVEGVHP